MEIKVDVETEKLILEALQTGRYADAEVLVGLALKHYLIAREFGEEYTREEIEAKVARGLAQLDVGESADGENFFESLRRPRKGRPPVV